MALHQSLTSFRPRISGAIANIDKELTAWKGKEQLLCILLAKRYNCSNPLNTIYVKTLENEGEQDDDVARVRTYLDVFYPKDSSTARELVEKNAGKMDELFAKLAANFHAIDPNKLRREREAYSKEVDYTHVLVEYLNSNPTVLEAEAQRLVEDQSGENHRGGKSSSPDAETVAERLLAKARGREALLFSILAARHETSNALDSVFEERLKEAAPKDSLSCLRLYLSIMHPAFLSEARSLMKKNKGAGGEEELFERLSRKFRAKNPLTVWKRPGAGLECVKEVEDDAQTQQTIDLSQTSFSSPERKGRDGFAARSPCVTP